MMLNDYLYEIGKNSKNICTDLDEDYCVVSKIMPVTDDELNKYINSILKAKEDGINIASIKDYRFIPGTTSHFKTNNGIVMYTRGVFLEDRARGNSFVNKNMYIYPGNEYDYNKIVLDYLKLVLDYIEELEIRVKAPQEMFDKLVSDCLNLENYGLTIDPKPLNFFFHPDCGFTLIDVLGNRDNEVNLRRNDYFPSYIYGIVLGFGPSTLTIKDIRYWGLPIDIQTRLYNALNALEIKIKTSLQNNGISNELIELNEKRNGYRFTNAYVDVSLEDMETEIVDIVKSYQSEPQAILKKPQDVNDWL